MSANQSQTSTEFMRALNFTEADLQANRDGYMTPAQRRRLARWQHPIYLLSFRGLVFLCFILFVVTLIIYSRRDLASTCIASIALIFGFTVMVVIMRIFERALNLQKNRYQFIKADLGANQVLHITGILQTRRISSGKKPSHQYFAEMGARTFSISKSAYELLEDNAPYTLYFLPNTMRLLSIEGFETPEIRLN